MNLDFPPFKARRPYICPPDAGPAWREAYEAGVDMAELEENLKLSPEQRLEKNDRLVSDFDKREAFFAMLERGRNFIDRVEAQRKIANQKSKI